VFFSRGKQRLWEKGETSGHTLRYVDAQLDCDKRHVADKRRCPRGPVCHTRHTDLFLGDEPRSEGEQLAFLGELERVIAARMVENPRGQL